MKLSEYAARNGIKYRAAWNRYKAGKNEGAYLDGSGHVVVPDPQHALIGKAAVYARVCTRKQRDDLDRQEADDPVRQPGGVVGGGCYQGSGFRVGDTRPRLTALLKEDSWGRLVVEHKDRLSRLGLGWFDVLLGLQGRRIVVADAATEQKVDLADDFVSVIYSFAAGRYGLRSARGRTDAVMVALGLDPAVGARLVTGQGGDDHRAPSPHAGQIG